MSVRKAQTDFYSPMTGNVFGQDRRRNDLIMKAIKTEMIKTDDPFTQIGEKKSYAPQEDPASISDAFDRDYGVLSDEEAAVIIEENKKKIEEPTPVVEPEPTPTPTPTPDPKPEVTPENTPEKAVEKATEYKKKGREAFMGNSARTMRLRANAKRKAQQSGGGGGRAGASSSSSSRGGSTGGSGASSKGSSRGSSSKSTGRGGARGGSTGGRGASSKGGSRGSRKGSTGRGGRRGGSRRCDIRCKFDISLLTNMNLVNDDLATLAYFVKGIQK